MRDVDLRTLYRADYRGPATPWIDPEKEINAQLARVGGGPLGSRQQAIRDLGGDPEVVFRQIQNDPLASNQTELEEPESDPATASDTLRVV